MEFLDGQASGIRRVEPSKLRDGRRKGTRMQEMEGKHEQEDLNVA
jgi:hypothetical protein